MSTDSLIYETFDRTTPHTTVGRYTAEDYLSLPEGERVELLRGRLMMMSPAPTPRHQLAGGQLYKILDACAATAGGLALPAPIDVALTPKTIAQPDVVYLRAGHEHLVGERINGVPDLVVEVLSPSTANRDRVEKLDLYAAAGVLEYWIVDPKTRIMEFHLLDGETYRVTTKDSGKYQSPQFAEVQINLTEFWRTVDQRLPPAKDEL